MLETLLSNKIVLENVIMIMAVLLSFGLAVLCGKKYNSGGSKGYLVASRVLIVLAAVLVIVWII